MRHMSFATENIEFPQSPVKDTSRHVCVDLGACHLTRAQCYIAGYPEGVNWNDPSVADLRS